MTATLAHGAQPQTKGSAKLYSNLCGDCFERFEDADIQRAADKLRDHKPVCRGPRHDLTGKQLW